MSSVGHLLPVDLWMMAHQHTDILHWFDCGSMQKMWEQLPIVASVNNVHLLIPSLLSQYCSGCFAGCLELDVFASMMSIHHAFFFACKRCTMCLGKCLWWKWGTYLALILHCSLYWCRRKHSHRQMYSCWIQLSNQYAEAGQLGSGSLFDGAFYSADSGKVVKFLLPGHPG